MSEMIEPDRTIMIVSVIGLVVIWGSFFYHRYLQDDRVRPASVDAEGGPEVEPSSSAQASVQEHQPVSQARASSRGKKGRQGKKRRK